MKNPPMRRRGKMDLNDTYAISQIIDGKTKELNRQIGLWKNQVEQQAIFINKINERLKKIERTFQVLVNALKEESDE